MILAIDLGSTNFKAASFSAGQRVGHGAGALRYAYGPGGRVELEPAHALQALQTAVAGALRDQSPAAIDAIAITSQAQTFTLVDDGCQPLTPFISWMDTRAGAACRALAAEGSLDDFARHVSFPALSPALQLCQLRHLRDTQPELLRASSRALLLPSWILAQLTGAAVCDTNLAAMSGLYSMAAGTWWPAALAACGIAANQLPALAPIGSPAACTRARSPIPGLSAGIPVVLAGNDQTAGAYGAGIHARDAMLITLGTCQVAYRAPAPVPDVRRTTAAGPYPGATWYAMAADVCGGNLVNWAQTVLAGCDSDERFFAAASAAAPGCAGLVFDIGADGNRNAWRGLTAGHTPGDCARSVIETLARRMAALARELCGPTLPRTCLVAGGGSHAASWVAILEAALKHPLTATEADPLAGAARMAAESLKRKEQCHDNGSAT